MAVGGTVAVIVCLGIGGKRRWACEVVCAVAVLVVVLTAVVYTCLWLYPWLVRSQMGGGDFVNLQYTMSYLSQDTVRHTVPLGSAVGALLGTIAGLLVVIARRWPRVAIGLIAALLLAGAMGPVQRSAFDLVVLCGYIVRWFIDSPGMTDHFVPALGATAGAIAGTIIAAVALWLGRKRPSLEGSPSEPQDSAPHDLRRGYAH
jgi:hypothetical protein